MVILLRAYVVLFSDTDHSYAAAPKILMKWPDSQEFDFDKGSPAAWWAFLRRLKVSGGALPTRTRDGMRVAYGVRSWGGGKVLNYFPGNDPKTGERCPVSKFGRLDTKGFGGQPITRPAKRCDACGRSL